MSLISVALASCLLGQASLPTGQWTPISEKILAELEKTHPKPTNLFATFTAGISVDRSNGDVYMLANNIGICKSTDQGRTFSLVSGNNVTGRCETGFGLNIDPRGRRLMCFTIYGDSAYSPDGGRSWTKSKQSHLDYGAVDWADTGQTFLAIGHESGGKLLYSPDKGQTWTNLGESYWGVGLFDQRTLLVAKEKEDGIYRSTDAGATWTKVSDEPVASPVMQVFNGMSYWLGEHGLLVSNDRGATWKIAGPLPKGASIGPMFGRLTRQMSVGATDGLYLSTNGGLSWDYAAPCAPEMRVLPRGKYATYGWDYLHNTYYASEMRAHAYRFVVGH